ncbi:nucleoid-associated protein [Clostridium sp. 19966]|uniref:nucleoid-associated protein n=1 Tax=Clostridium sp. 19966 TaxID=2768166 RepID=UPI0028DF4F9E|nr:nucleoid-associated protein [Clostridium sp. 19966]MDT8718532.1 nucleoid-associated protein [Clostridium sp. 19966]
MEYVSEISIMEAVVHILDVNSDEPVLNEYHLDLNEDVYKFVLKHVERTLKDEELKYAFFNDGRGIVKELTQEYLNGQNDLITISKELSKNLFYLMKSNSNIPSCDLMTVAFTTEYGPMLGIIKMDYVKNYIHKIDFVEDKMNISIIPQDTGLPVSAQRIQKCAFIKQIKEGMNFHLMVIDKQSKNKDEDYGSNYFINSFLGCYFINNERDMTKTLVQAAENWTRANAADDAVKAEGIRSTLKKKLKEEDTIQLNELSESLFSDEADKESFKNFVGSQGIDNDVVVDKNWVEKKLKRVRLKIDKDIDLYINEETYHDNSKFEIVRNGDGSINMVIKHVINYIEK